MEAARHRHARSSSGPASGAVLAYSVGQGSTLVAALTKRPLGLGHNLLGPDVWAVEGLAANTPDRCSLYKWVFPGAVLLEGSSADSALAQVKAREAFARSLGFSDLRCCDQGPLLRLKLPKSQSNAARQKHDNLLNQARAACFSDLTLGERLRP